MKTNFKMKEATNKEEAIISILDVLDENPLRLNKITDSLFILVKNIEQVLETARWAPVGGNQRFLRFSVAEEGTSVAEGTSNEKIALTFVYSNGLAAVIDASYAIL